MSTGLHSICIRAEQWTRVVLLAALPGSLLANNSKSGPKYGARVHLACTNNRLDLPSWRRIYALQLGRISGTPQHPAPSCSACSIAQRKMRLAGWITRLYSAITRSFSIQNSQKLLQISALLLSFCKPSFTCFLKILSLQNYKHSRWDVDWAVYNLHQSRTIDPCHAIESVACLCSCK